MAFEPIPANLLPTFAPIFKLDPREKHQPTTVEAFLREADLLSPNGHAGRICLWRRAQSYCTWCSRGNVTPQKLAQVCRDESPQQFVLDIRKHNDSDCPPLELDEVPVYAHAKSIVDGNGTREAIELNYILFFPYCARRRLAGGLLCTGGHVGDWEHITVRLDPTGSRMQGVYYHVQQYSDGEWLPSQYVPQEDGRPVVYVARNTHGCYPCPGLKIRWFFVAADYCSDDSVTWRPSTVVVLKGTPVIEDSCRTRGCCLEQQPAAKEVAGRRDRYEELKAEDQDNNHHPNPQVDYNKPLWLDFPGYWGTVQGPAEQQWFRQAENPYSWGWFKRLFCPCWVPPYCQPEAIPHCYLPD